MVISHQTLLIPEAILLHLHCLVLRSMIFNFFFFFLVSKHNIHIKPKSYKFELLGELVNMVSELGLAGGLGFESTSLQFESLFVYLKVHEGL